MACANFKRNCEREQFARNVFGWVKGSANSLRGNVQLRPRNSEETLLRDMNSDFNTTLILKGSYSV